MKVAWRQNLSRLFWLCVGGVFLILLLFLASNLFLASGLGQSFLQKQITRRAPNLQWSVEKASWSPWRGVTLTGVHARLKEHPEAPPLLTFQSTRLQPYWAQALRGRKIFRELDVNQLQLNIPIELLLVAAPAQEPALTNTPQAPAPTVAPQAEPEHKGTTPTQPPTQPESETAQNPQPAPKQKLPTTQAKPPKQPDERRLWLRLNDASVRLYSFSHEHSFTVDGLEVDLPLAGPPTQGSLSWKSISTNQSEILSKTQLPIQWQYPSWTLATTRLPITIPPLEPLSPEAQATTLEAQVAGNLAVRHPSQYFAFKGFLPTQAFPPYNLHPKGQVIASAQEISANLVASGHLLYPQTWKVDSLAAANQIEVLSHLRGEPLLFDTARSRIRLRQAVLALPLLSLRSEQLSLMGNGQLGLNGYLLGVMRIVADPHLESRFTNVAIGSLISKGWTRHWMSPLETPDRYYRDLHIEGVLPNPQINVGRKGEFLFASQIQQLLKRFLDREIAEEAPLLPLPTP